MQSLTWQELGLSFLDDNCESLRRMPEVTSRTDSTTPIEKLLSYSIDSQNLKKNHLETTATLW
jgi:hypothetical protein